MSRSEGTNTRKISSSNWNDTYKHSLGEGSITPTSTVKAGWFGRGTDKEGGGTGQGWRNVGELRGNAGKQWSPPCLDTWRNQFLHSLCPPFWLIWCPHCQIPLLKHLRFYPVTSLLQNHPLFFTPYTVKPEPGTIKDFCDPALRNLSAVIFHCWEILLHPNVWQQSLWSQTADVNLLSSTSYLCDPGQIT